MLKYFISGGVKHTEVAYKAPLPIRESCEGQRIHRQKEMRKALASIQETSGFGLIWKPDSQDIEDERAIFKARDMITQKNFGFASFEMHPESLARMKQGLDPLSQDKEWISRTAGIYLAARRKVFALIEMHLQRKFHIRYLWSFDTKDLVRPLLNMGDLIIENIKSPNEQLWCYSVWKTILGIQIKMASKENKKFKASIRVNI